MCKWQTVSTSLGNSLAPNKEHTIFWNNDNQVHYQLYAALFLDILTSEFA